MQRAGVTTASALAQSDCYRCGNLPGPDEIAYIQVTLLGQHVREQCVARNVEGYAEENICTALVQLAGELGFATRFLRRCHIELKEGVTGHECHLIEVSHIPGTDNDATAVRIVLELLNHFGDLVDVAAVRLGPAAPLTPYTGPREPSSRAHSSQIVHPRSCSHFTLLSPRRNHSSSRMMDLR